MHNYDFGAFGGYGQHGPYGEPEGAPRRHSVFSLVVTIIVVAVGAAIVLGLLFWTLGLVFSIAGWIIRIAILAAVAALVWRRLTRHRAGTSC